MAVKVKGKMQGEPRFGPPTVVQELATTDGAAEVEETPCGAAGEEESGHSFVVQVTSPRSSQTQVNSDEKWLRYIGETY